MFTETFKETFISGTRNYNIFKDKFILEIKTHLFSSIFVLYILRSKICV